MTSLQALELETSVGIIATSQSAHIKQQTNKRQTNNKQSTELQQSDTKHPKLRTSQTTSTNITKNPKPNTHS